MENDYNQYTENEFFRAFGDLGETVTEIGRNLRDHASRASAGNVGVWIEELFAGSTPHNTELVFRVHYSY